MEDHSLCLQGVRGVGAELNAKEESCALLIDVAKAFPCVPHPLLLHMLEQRGVTTHAACIDHAA